MNIFVAKLDYNTTSEDLQELFESYGTVDSAKVIYDRDTGRSKGFGFVEMPDDDDAFAAIQGLDGFMLDGKAIVVKKAEERRNDNPRGGGGGGGGYNRGGGGYNGGGGYGGGGGNNGYNRY